MNLLRAKDPKRYAKVWAALATGASVREASDRWGVARETVRRLRKQIVALFAKSGKVIRCGCGQPAGHNGWCRYRFLKSPRRQLALALLHARQRAKKS